MHIIIGALTSIATILYLLHRLAEMGIDLAGLNPFLWRRRRKWRTMYTGNPVYKIDNPMDATAILMVAVAKADGDMTREDKNQVLDLFESEFHLSKKDAVGLLISSAHLLGDGNEVRHHVAQFLAPSRDAFSETQAESAVTLIGRVAGDVPDRHPNVQELVHQVEKVLRPARGEQADVVNNQAVSETRISPDV